MSSGRVPSRGSDQFNLRFPDGMRDQIKLYADANGRSMNAEIINRLTRTLDEDQHHADMIEADKQRVADDSRNDQQQSNDRVQGGMYMRPAGMDDEQFSKLLENAFSRSHQMAQQLFVEELVKLGGSYKTLEDLEKEHAASATAPTKADE